MTQTIRMFLLVVSLSALSSCQTLPEHRTLAAGNVAKTGTPDDQAPRFTKREFCELLVRLKPMFEESGFRCYDDGTSGGFSIIEGPIHYASYGMGGPDGTSLRCLIKATRKGLHIEINDYEDQRGSGHFTTTKAETDAVSVVVQRIRELLSSSYPGVALKVKTHET